MKSPPWIAAIVLSLAVLFTRHLSPAQSAPAHEISLVLLTPEEQEKAKAKHEQWCLDDVLPKSETLPHGGTSSL